LNQKPSRDLGGKNLSLNLPDTTLPALFFGFRIINQTPELTAKKNHTGSF